MENRAVALRQQFSHDELQIIKRTVANKTNDDQFKLFIQVCKYSGLNPFARQIYAVVRGNEMSIQTGIDGYRLLAERSGAYLGQLGPQWCGPDGAWVDIWLKDEPPTACKVGILRRGFEQPVWGVARYKAFYVESNPLWKKMPDHMLSIRAEALALRKAFPSEMSGIYTKEEMEQAENDRMPLPSVSVESVAHDASAETVTGEIVDVSSVPGIDDIYKRGKEIGIWNDTRTFFAATSAMLSKPCGKESKWSVDDRRELNIMLDEKVTEKAAQPVG